MAGEHVVEDGVAAHRDALNVDIGLGARLRVVARPLGEWTLFGARVGRNNPFDDDFGAGRNGQVAQFGFYQFHGFLHERARFFVLAAVARQPRDGAHHDAGVVTNHDRHGHVLTLVLVFLVDVRPWCPLMNQTPS